MSEKRTPVIRSERVRVAEREVGAGAGSKEAQPAEAAPATVRLIRDGDTVTSVEVCCACGRVIILDCKYADLAQTLTPEA
jgi:hypothetical protein